MKRLVGNPAPVPTPDSHCMDESDEYDDSYADEYRATMEMGDPKGLKDDVDKLVQACADKGYIIAPEHAFYAWDQVSQVVSAHWLCIDAWEGAFEAMRPFLIEVE